MALTAPVEVAVVLAAKSAEAQTPSWVSLPSIAAPAACGRQAVAAGLGPQGGAPPRATQSSAIAASRAKPCRR